MRRMLDAAALGEDGFDAEDAELSNVDAREAARRATDPVNAIDIPSAGGCRPGVVGGCWGALGRGRLAATFAPGASTAARAPKGARGAEPALLFSNGGRAGS